MVWGNIQEIHVSWLKTLPKYKKKVVYNPLKKGWTFASCYSWITLLKVQYFTIFFLSSSSSCNLFFASSNAYGKKNHHHHCLPCIMWLALRCSLWFCVFVFFLSPRCFLYYSKSSHLSSKITCFCSVCVIK